MMVLLRWVLGGYTVMGAVFLDLVSRAQVEVDR